MTRPLPLRRLATGLVRRLLLSPGQRWQFDPPPRGWMPPPIERTSLYLHVPFCRHACPYCPSTKIRYDEALLDGFTHAALSEVDWWAQATGPCEITSVYIDLHSRRANLVSVRNADRGGVIRFPIICVERAPKDRLH